MAPGRKALFKTARYRATRWLLQSNYILDRSRGHNNQSVFEQGFTPSRQFYRASTS